MHIVINKVLTQNIALSNNTWSFLGLLHLLFSGSTLER